MENKSERPLVSVVMITYGHEAFIAEAISGILMQQVDFEVELIIADDASPDKTPVVVEGFKEHENFKWIKYTRHTENKGMMLNFIWAMDQAKGKYIALCEGDDYWTDPYKLQKQVHFLEENEEYGLCFTETRTLCEDNLTGMTADFGTDREIDLYRLWTKDKGGSTASMVFFKDALFSNRFRFFTGYGVDVQLVSQILLNGYKAYRIPDVTCVYRLNVGIMNNYFDQLPKWRFLLLRVIVAHKILDFNYRIEEQSRNQMELAILFLLKKSMKLAPLSGIILLLFWFIKISKSSNFKDNLKFLRIYIFIAYQKIKYN